MKKLMIAAAIVCAAALAQAASIGWTNAGLGNFAGDAYKIFVIGQGGDADHKVSDIAAITAMLDAGTDVSAYEFGSGTISGTGTANVLASNSGKTLDAGTYTSFLVVFNSDDPVAGQDKYCVVSGIANQTITFSATKASASFGTGNSGAAIVNDPDNWKSYGPSADTPEPTSGLLLLLGVAGLALKRKRA